MEKAIKIIDICLAALCLAIITALNIISLPLGLACDGIKSAVINGNEYVARIHNKYNA